MTFPCAPGVLPCAHAAVLICSSCCAAGEGLMCLHTPPPLFTPALRCLPPCLQDYSGAASLSSYMTLPVEQYFVLDPSQIIHLGANRFLLKVPRINVSAPMINTSMPRLSQVIHLGGAIPCPRSQPRINMSPVASAIKQCDRSVGCQLRPFPSTAHQSLRVTSSTHHHLK